VATGRVGADPRLAFDLAPGEVDESGDFIGNVVDFLDGRKFWTGRPEPVFELL